MSEGLRPSRSTRAGERYLALRALAKRTERTTAELLQMYVLEALWRDTFRGSRGVSRRSKHQPDRR
ncbi:MAG: hypothetical protein R3B40_17865 [Polyangiales bacterium]